MTPAEEILLDIATGENSKYESEYDGRVYYYCRYCDASLNGDHSEEAHDEDCKVFAARKALGSIWTDYVAEQEAKRKAAEALAEARRRVEAEEARKRAYDRERVPCDDCGRKVARIGMAAHKASGGCARKLTSNAQKAGEQATGIVCISDPLVNYEGKRCLQCNKPMPDAHPNAKFCSNKGAGNCKDRHNNLQPHRIERAKVYSGQLEADVSARRNSLLDRLEWLDSREGWDEHKDCF